jgi:bifunctional non-homologous end joining protein LigD
VRDALKRSAAGALSFDAAAVLERVRERGDLFSPVLTLHQKPPAI